MVRKSKKVSKINYKEIINDSIAKGLNLFTDTLQYFKGKEEYLGRYIDSKKLQGTLNGIFSRLNEVKKGGWITDDQKRSYLHKSLVDYISSGQAFNDEGKEIFFGKSLENKLGGFGKLKKKNWNPLRKISEKKISKNEKYLENTLGMFQELYGLFATGDYVQRMPELAKVVVKMNDSGFLYPAAKVLKYHGKISDKQYNLILKDMVKLGRDADRKVLQGIRDYLTPEKVQTYKKAAAFFIGITGVFLIISNGLNITGGVIGSLSNNITGIIGIGLMIGGIALFLSSKEKGGLEKNLAQTYLDGGTMILNTRKLIKVVGKICKEKGYSTKNVKEGLQILDQYGNPLEVIPKHPTIGKGLYRKIMKTLAIGESNFRKYGTSTT